MVGEAFGPDAELADAKVVEAAADRRRRRRERELGGAEATLRGLLAGLAEAGAAAVVVTDLGHRLAGSLDGPGVDCIEVELATGGLATIRLSTVVAVETPGSSPSGSTRSEPPGQPVHLADVIAGYVGSEIDVGLWLRGGIRVDGEIASCGSDVILVRPGDRAGAIYVALESVNEVWSGSRP